MKKYIFLVLFSILVSVHPTLAEVNIAVSLTDLGSIASYIGGDKVSVFSIARSNADPHSVEVLPSYMVRVSRAQIYLKIGLGLDQWADGIIDGSRNAELNVVDCSRGINVLEKPSTKVTALQGDVHPEGNPHYWLDPRNGLVIAQTIHDALLSLDPANRAIYDENLVQFKSELESHLTAWTAISEGLISKTIITYHASWIYFAEAFGFTIAQHIEPVPGLPPTAGHLAELLGVIKQRSIISLLQEPYFSDDAPQYLARETGIHIIKVPPSCSDVSPSSYFDHFQTLLSDLQNSER